MIYSGTKYGIFWYASYEKFMPFQKISEKSIKFASKKKYNRFTKIKQAQIFCSFLTVLNNIKDLTYNFFNHSWF